MTSLRITALPHLYQHQAQNMSLPSIVSQHIDAMIADEFSAEGTLTLDHHYHCRPVADLETAVADASLSTVFIILAEWQVTKQMLDHTSKIRPLFTATALVMALQCNRSDIISLLLSTNSAIRMPVKQAVHAGYVANFQAFPYNGWDINAQLDLDGSPALGYVDSCLHRPFTSSWLQSRRQI